jgi:hypothetical protein
VDGQTASRAGRDEPFPAVYGSAYLSIFSIDVPLTPCRTGERFVDRFSGKQAVAGNIPASDTTKEEELSRERIMITGFDAEPLKVLLIQCQIRASWFKSGQLAGLFNKHTT